MSKEWIIPANSKNYKHAESFKENGFIDWRQTRQMNNIKVGDVVYVYLSKNPFGSIRFKTLVSCNITPDNKVDDYKFWINITKAEYELEKKQYQFLRLVLLKEADNVNLSLYKLKEKGFVTKNNNMQGVLQIRDSDFSNYLENYFKN